MVDSLLPSAVHRHRSPSSSPASTPTNTCPGALFHSSTPQTGIYSLKGMIDPSGDKKNITSRTTRTTVNKIFFAFLRWFSWQPSALPHVFAHCALSPALLRTSSPFRAVCTLSQRLQFASLRIPTPLYTPFSRHTHREGQNSSPPLFHNSTRDLP